MKKITAIIMTIALAALTAMPAFASDTQVITFGGSAGNTDTTQTAPVTKGDPTKPYLALGSDLSQAQLATVLNAMGLAGTDLSQYNVVYVTNAEEHQYLDAYIDPAVIGTRSLSSVLVKPASSGHGITVNAYNINYCTTGMYKNALLTAGVEDADIIVAAPSSISGTAALIGALKAYSGMTGEPLNTQALDTSLNELVTTGQIEEVLDGASKEEVESMIAFIKAEIAGKDLNTREEIDKAVREAIKDYNEMSGTKYELSESEIKQIVDLMVKIKALGLDYNTLLDQAADIYGKFGDKLSADQLGQMAAEGVMGSIKKSVGDAVKGVYEGVKGFFSGLFSK